MSISIPRRRLVTGLASSAGAMLAGCGGSGPPTYGNILRMGDLVTYRAHRLLMPAQSLVREYNRSDISSSPAIGNTNPGDSGQPFFDPDQGEIYARLQRGAFADWRLAVEGSVTRPASFSLDDLRRMPSRTQITQHRCEEGWSAIAEWTGVPLRAVLEAVGVRPEARYVQLQSFDFFGSGIDMWDATHPQTILAYGMNGRDIPTGHGAPVRLRVETQLGYRSLKFVRRIVVTNEFQDDGTIAAGWSWYAGI
jgi:DMSO/TMAO reductase YedYZ molybdopterin-dependent catalytic subunit